MREGWLVATQTSPLSVSRMRIQLSAEQRRQLKRWAHYRGISRAEAVRRCVAERLAADFGLHRLA